VTRPSPRTLPAESVRDFRDLLDSALSEQDERGRVWADAQWGCYAFYDYDGEPIYVGQTNEQLRTRVRRHLTNQRTDAVAMRVLDVFEVAEMQLWPLWQYQGLRRQRDPRAHLEAVDHLNAVEYSAYLDAIERSSFGAVLNEKIPPPSLPVPLPVGRRFALISEKTRRERGHPDIRISRRAETLARLAAVVHERGVVSPGLRRVLVIQAVRLAFLSATRLAYSEGRAAPDPRAVDLSGLVGDLLVESSDPDGPTDDDDMLF
jgi:hypothetical protein